MPEGGRIGAGVLLVSLALAQACIGAGVYRWVDPEGGVHFSDVPPPGESAQVQRVPVFLPEPGVVAPDPYYYSIANQARRMEEQRLRLSQERRARREVAAERRRREEVAAAQAQGERQQEEAAWRVYVRPYGYPLYGLPYHFSGPPWVSRRGYLAGSPNPRSAHPASHRLMSEVGAPSDR